MSHAEIRLTLPDVDTRVVVRGDGPPVLLLHGNPDTAELWDGVADDLAPSYRCYAPDLPGFGGSRLTGGGRRTGHDFSLDAMETFVAGLVEGLGIDEPLRLVVHDFGGPYGFSWAVRHPERVRQIVAVNTFFFPDYRWHFWARVWRTSLLGELSMLLMRWPVVRLELRRGSRRLTTEQMRAVYERVTPETRRTILRLYRATSPEVFAPWQEAFEKLVRQVPTAVVWGMRDPYLPARFADRFFAREVHRLEDCGHWPPSEAPGEVAAVLEAFFALGGS